MTLFAGELEASEKRVREAGAILPPVLLAVPYPTCGERGVERETAFKNRLEAGGLTVEVHRESPAGSAEGVCLSRVPFVRAVTARLNYLRSLFRRLPACQILHLVYKPGVSAFSQIMPMVILGRFLGKKVILDYRSPVLLNRVAGRGWLLQKLWRMCHAVLVPSAYQRQLVNSMGGRAEWVPGVLPTEDISPKVVRTIQPRIIVDTELEKEHNVVSAIKAYYIVKQKYPRTELVVVGDGLQRSGLEKLVEIKNIPGISFVGSPNMAERIELYGGCDLMVNCSTIDHLPESVALAFACGLPVITTPISGGGETYRSRENILLTTYNDHASLADKIIELVEDPDLTEKLSVNGATTAQALTRCTDSAGWSRFYSLLANKTA